MKIAFALAIHSPDDDRVWEQQSQALLSRGHEVFIVSATSKPQNKEEVFCFEREIPHLKKIDNFAHYLSKINPDVVICDHPESILGARKCKKKAKKRQLKIYYDITERYPSKTYFHHASKIKNILKFPLMCAISFYVSWLVSGFIFGEYYKARPYKLFFWKKSVDLTYYADLNQIKTYPINTDFKQFVLFFAGKLSETSGFKSLLQTAKQCAKRFPNIDFVLRVVSRDCNYEFDTESPNLTVEFLPQGSFKVFCEEIGKADLFFDLRKIDWENSHSLPIKLFYYMSAGRPVIYSDLKAIRKGVPEIDEFGFLVNPENSDEIAKKISQYIEDKNLYKQHCLRVRQLAENKYNWENIKKPFVDFIEKL
jgi:glycosyltransferase involved in cell wall biosynthesis